LNLKIDNLWVVNIFSVEVWITETIFNTWIVMLFLIIAALVIRIILTRRKLQTVPTGLQNAVETLIEMLDGLVKSTAGEKLAFLGHWFFMAFAFILAANLSGLVGFRPPTADWATTFALALGTFILIQVTGIRFQKWNYIKGFFDPVPIFLPLNIIGEIARPVSLSFRLFGNVLAGTIIVSLVYWIAPFAARFAFPAALHVYFDIFVSSLHTYIFCVLSLSFIGAAAEG